MRAYPELLRGSLAADARLIAELPGWVGKGGAEGLFCAVSPEGLTMALKSESGTFRAIVPALAVFLSRLGIDPGGLGPTPVSNSHGVVVGEVVAG
jgi:L-asparaginase II